MGPAPETMAATMLAGRWEGVELCQARYVTHRFPVHAHAEVHVALIEAGRYGFRLDGRPQLAEAGDIMLLRPDEPHDGAAADPAGYAYRQALIPVPLWEETMAAAGRHPPGPAVRRSTAAAWLRRAFAAYRDRDALVLDAALAATILELGGGSAGRTTAAPRAVRQALDLMRAQFAAPLTLADLAAATGTSRFALARAFRHHTGIGIHEWLMTYRLRQARRCLAQGMAAAEAAAANGFADQSHLIRRFKRTYGVTPGQFATACTSIQS